VGKKCSNAICDNALEENGICSSCGKVVDDDVYEKAQYGAVMSNVSFVTKEFFHYTVSLRTSKICPKTACPGIIGGNGACGECGEIVDEFVYGAATYGRCPNKECAKDLINKLGVCITCGGVAVQVSSVVQPSPKKEKKERMWPKSILGDKASTWGRRKKTKMSTKAPSTRRSRNLRIDWRRTQSR